TGRVAMISQMLILAALGWRYAFHYDQIAVGKGYFSGMIYQSATSEWMRLFLLFCSMVVCHIGSVFLRNRPLARVEFYHLVLVVSAGLMLLVQSHDFLFLFVILEAAT